MSEDGSKGSKEKPGENDQTNGRHTHAAGGRESGRRGGKKTASSMACNDERRMTVGAGRYRLRVGTRSSRQKGRELRDTKGLKKGFDEVRSGQAPRLQSAGGGWLKARGGRRGTEGKSGCGLKDEASNIL